MDKLEFEGKMKEILREQERNLELLVEKTVNLDEDLKQGVNALIVKARSARATTAQRLEELRNSSDAAWGDLRSGVESAARELKRSVQEAFNKLS